VKSQRSSPAWNRKSWRHNQSIAELGGGGLIAINPRPLAYASHRSRTRQRFRYESANLTTAFRILDAAAKRGHDINVFAYEGAAALAFTRQSPHPNPVHGKNLAEEIHPTTKDQVAALLAEAAKNGGKVDWVNCGMCVDERGVNEFVPGTRRGSPADLQAFLDASDNTLVIPTK
jgi:tRNA 2-thiouridine synthesizing protein D